MNSDPAGDDLEGRIEEMIAELSKNRLAATRFGLGWNFATEAACHQLHMVLAEWRDRWRKGET